MIVYIGNNLKRSSSNVTTMVLLSTMLRNEGYTLTLSSSYNNQLLRLLDMLFTVYRNRNRTRFVLIDTYSSLNFYYAYAVARLCQLIDIPYIPILHGGNLPDRLVRSKKMSEIIFNRSYRNIAPSLFLKAAFAKHGYEVDCIPNVLEVGKYEYKLRTCLQPKLLYVRAFSKIYNPKMAIEVLQHLKKKYENASLCMVGPDKDGSLQAVKAYAKQLGLESSVTFTGKLSKEEWHRLAQDFDVFINTTNFDNTPLSVMEAMALGLPVVSTNVGGVPYLIEHGTNGMLVDKGDADAMSIIIDELIQHSEQSVSLSVQARKKVQSFDWEEVKGLWKAVLG